jgi:hypothetical protein
MLKSALSKACTMYIRRHIFPGVTVLYYKMSLCGYIVEKSVETQSNNWLASSLVRAPNS